MCHCFRQTFKRSSRKRSLVDLPIISALERLRQDSYEIKASLGYIMSARTTWATE